MKTKSLIASVRALVVKECANHQGSANGVKDFCWMRERSGATCVFFSDLPDPRCGYFEGAVLPLAPHLGGIFSGGILSSEIRGIRRRGATKTCHRCGQPFQAASNRQEHCEKCQKGARNDRNRAWMTESRKSTPGMSVVDV